MSEAFSTFAADVGPLACVYPHMLPQIGRLGEGLFTHCAGVRLETKMDILMSSEAA